MNPFEVFELVVAAIRNGRAELFFDTRLMQKCCVIGDVLLAFEVQEEGSLVVRHQNLVLMWMRETPGWDEATRALQGVIEDENADSFEIRRRLFRSLTERLAQVVSVR